ncbi:hypothetical protein [Variovorax sp. HJSM1_2]|uniref:hypothetical protein n=1 Tax=Variovorax sp. HJSM1_2 TaxID=3366263 RepID=UPI003BC65AE5
MAKKDWSQALTKVNFRCTVCQRAFEAVPDLVEPYPEQAYHPFLYFAHCPRELCQAPNQPQATWEKALLKAHQAATGPRTAAGLAATAANLDGHPTPEESQRTRFNAMKHGLNARVATYFPAKPGGYTFCKSCDVDWGWCGQQPACVKRAENFLLHHAAFDQRNPKVLGAMHADLQAALTSLLQMLMQEVLGDGVVIRVPKVELARDGTPVTLTYEDEQGKTHKVMSLAAHPALKPITDLVSRLGLSMTDLGMTVRAAEPDEEEAGGRLGLSNTPPEHLEAFSQRMLTVMQGAQQLLVNAETATRNDPVLVAHEAQQAKHTPRATAGGSP